MPMPIEIGWMLVAVAFTHVTINSTDIEPEIQYECVSFDINDILLNMKTNSIHSMSFICCPWMRWLIVEQRCCNITPKIYLKPNALLVKLISHSISNLKQIIITHYY